MVWADNRRPLKPQAKFRSRVIQCGICGGQSGNGTGFPRTASVFLSQYHSTIVPCLLLLPEGQAGKAWEPSNKQTNKQMSLRMSRTIERKILQNSGFGGLNLSNSSSSRRENKAVNVRVNTIQVRSCHHCGSVKAINTYSECFICSLRYPACSAHAPYCQL
jgi:hypothetical protein